jgi:RNA polymerase sigma factor (TIGR02999 family)
MAAPGDITLLLQQWRDGQVDAFEQLVPAVYQHLHQVAQAFLVRDRQGHTLQATGLVNELFLRLLQNRSVQYHDRVHFYAFAAKLMRRILVDSARQHRAQKRGDGAQRVPLAPELAFVDAASPELLDLDAALLELANLDPMKVQILELRFFLGLTQEETAEMLDVSRSTVDRALRFAVSWLHARLQRP